MAEQGVRWPLVNNQISSGNLGQNSNVYGANVRTTGPHQGWDLSAPVGTPIYAIQNGRVEASEVSGSYGQRITIRLDDVELDGSPVYVMYGHLQSRLVGNGETVSRGQLIGYTGITGNANANNPHLHIELRSNASPGTGMNGRFDPARLYGNPPMAHTEIDCVDCAPTNANAATPDAANDSAE